MREMVAGMILLKKDENIRGHVFLSILALVLRKELESPLERYGYCLSLNYFFATVQDQPKLINDNNYLAFPLCQDFNFEFSIDILLYSFILYIFMTS